MFFQKKRRKKRGRKKRTSNEIRLLIGYVSQFSSLPVSIRTGRYNRTGIEDREKRVEVAEFERNEVRIPNRLSDAAHSPHSHFLHTHSQCFCLSETVCDKS